MVRMLQLQGVTHLFGLCGDTSLPFYDALNRLDHGITHVLTRDERSAAYMADGYARVSGKPGVCEGPSGGGATYILPGVVEANESSIALLAITSDISVSSRGRFTLTELDQAALFAPLTKWTTVIDRAEQIPQVVRTAFARMTDGRPGAAHIGLPFDVQRLAHETWDEVRMRARRRATLDDLHVTLRRLLAEQQVVFEGVWQRLTLAQRAALRAVVIEEGRELLASDVRERHRLGGPSTVQAALTALVREEIVAREGNRYAVVDSLLREWVARRTY